MDLEDGSKSHFFYEMTKNPHYPWSVYKLCCDMGYAIPSWVLRYFYEASSHYINMLNNHCRDSSYEIDYDKLSEALGFKTPGRRGAGNWFTDIACPDSKLLDEITDEIASAGKKKLPIEYVAERHGMKYHEVRRFYERYTRLAKLEKEYPNWRAKWEASCRISREKSAP